MAPAVKRPRAALPVPPKAAAAAQLQAAPALPTAMLAEHALEMRSSIGTEFFDFTLENAFGFSGQHVIPMQDQGLVNVLGRNQETAEESSSGAGKSRAFRLFVYLQYGSKALGSNESVSDLRLFGSNFMLSLRLRRNSRFYMLRETYKYGKEPSGLALYEYESGFDSPCSPIGPVNDPTALRAFYQRLISLTYDEFVGTVILPQRFGHTLIRGKPAARIQWLSDLYGLTAYAEMHKSLSENLDDVRSQVSRLLEVRGRYNVIADDLAAMTAETNIDDLQVRLDKARSDVVALDTKIETARTQLTTTQRRLDSLQRLRASIETAEAQDLSSVERGMALAGTLVADFEAKAQVVRDELAGLRHIASLQAQLADVDAEIEAAGAIVPTEADRSEYQELGTQIIPGLRAQSAKSREVPQALTGQRSAVLAEIHKATQTHGLPADATAIQAVMQAARDQVSDLRGACSNHNTSLSKINAALRVSSGCECPTCMQSVDNHELLQSYKDDLSEKIQAATTSIRHHEATLAAADTALRGLRSLEDLRLRIDAATEAAKAREELVSYQERYTQLGTMLREADRVQKLLGQQEALVAQLGSNVSLDTSADVADLEAAVATHVATRQRYRSADAAHTAVYNAASQVGIQDPFAIDLVGELQLLTQNRDRNSEWLVAASQKRDTAMLQIDRWRAVLAGYKQKSTQLAQLSSQLQRLESLEDDEIVLAATKKAYDKSGMKVDRLKALLEKIRKGLPKWTRILFTEPYFDVKVDSEDSKSLSLLVTKRHVVNGKEKISWIDASELSGGEESRFALCVMLTLMSQVAPEKRTNVLIIDEADAGLDDLGKRLMAELLLVMMKAAKPTMYVITHQLQIERGVIDGNLIVTKSSDGLSRIEMCVENA